MHETGGHCRGRSARLGSGGIAAPPEHHSRPAGGVRGAAAADAGAAAAARAAAVGRRTRGLPGCSCATARRHCRGAGTAFAVPDPFLAHSSRSYHFQNFLVLEGAENKLYLCENIFNWKNLIKQDVSPAL